MRSSSPRPLPLLAASALPLLIACGEEPAAAAPEVPVWPEGTVVVIGGAPITESEVDRWLPLIEQIEPQFVEKDHRRKALANIVLPIKAASVLDPASRELAYQEAERLHSHALETGELPTDGSVVLSLTGTWRDVGMMEWQLTKDLEPGEFSELFEDVGAWAFFRVVERPTDEEWVPRSEISIERVWLPYLPVEDLRGLVDDSLRQLPIEVLDEEWEDIVPPWYRYSHGTDSGR